MQIVCICTISLLFTCLCYCGSPTTVCKHIQRTIQLLCPLISTLERLIYSVSVIMTMKFATGISIRSPVFVFQRLAVFLSDTKSTVYIFL